jgi:hypothetical protein
MQKGFYKLFYPAVVLCFLGIMLLPLTDMIWHYVPESKNHEQRQLAPLPVLCKDSLSVFAKRFEAYFNDHFGYRDYFVQLSSAIKFYVFGASPVPEKVAVGKHNWLFLSGRFYGITQDLSREHAYTDSSLTADVNLWIKRKTELQNMGISYYKAFWPDKYYIYPELLPLSMVLENKSTDYRCDQALQYIKQHKSSISILDVRPHLMQKKHHYKIYHASDSHWNNLGAFYAYSALMQTLAWDRPELKPKPISCYNVKWRLKPAGDLATLLNVYEPEYEPQFYERFKNTAIEIFTNSDYPKKTRIFKNPHSLTPLRALIFRDSFTNALIPFLSQHFSEMVLIWDSPYSLEMVNRVKPDIVIECYASRYFR